MFRIDGLLGEGGMGRVYAAHDLNLDRSVAIKVLHERFANDGQMASRFLREARLLARLSSVNTVRVHSIARTEQGTPYIVMERALGQDLDALVEERGPLPVPEMLDYVRQMCAALGEAHAVGIVHRDVKPGNVLVGTAPTGEPLVKVVDFGVAKESLPPGEDASGLTTTTALFGTPEYMSPEQRRSTRDVDHLTDIWSLGATMFFMLVGRAPFAADNLAELLHLIQHGPTPSVREFRPEIAPEIDAVIARCLHRDPHGRFKSTAEIVAALTPFAINVPAAGSTDPLLSAQFPEPPSDPTPIMTITEAPAERTVAMPSPPVRPPPPPPALTPIAPAPPQSSAIPPFVIAIVVILALAIGGAILTAFVLLRS